MALTLCKNGMMLVQRVKGDHKTFNDIAQKIFEMAMKEGISAQRVDIVFGKYRDLSIKSFERDLRGEHHGTSLQSIAGQQPFHQWR